jgi:hypothetical protein
MQRLERCLACRARLGEADECPRCGTDFSSSRRAVRQSLAFARRAVRALASGRIQEAAIAADTASLLASPLLARAVARMIRKTTAQ